MPLNKKRFFKWITIPFIILVPTLTSALVIVSCANNTSIPSTPPIIPPTPPIDESVKNLTREDLYTIKRSRTKNDQLVGVVAVDLNKVLKDVHVVDDSVSNLPSYFVLQPDRVSNLIDLQREDFIVSFNITDYDDSLRHSDHRIYFPEFERGYPSTLKHTVITGRGLYSLVNTNEKYETTGKFTSNLSFSWLDVQINFVHKTDVNIKYHFNETFIFREGIGEHIFGKRQGNAPGESRFIIDATKEQKQITGWNQAGTFANIESDVYHTLVNENTEPNSFNPIALRKFIDIKHFKPQSKMSDADEAMYISDIKTVNNLPPFLPYQPYLALDIKPNDDDYAARLVSVESKKNNNADMIKILVNNENIKSQSNQTTIRWHNFGKPNNIDYYYRGSVNANGDNFATVFNLWYRFI